MMNWWQICIKLPGIKTVTWCSAAEKFKYFFQGHPCHDQFSLNHQYIPGHRGKWLLITSPLTFHEPLTFAQIWFPPINGRDEKGNRCKSGAIPVAVMPENGVWLVVNRKTTTDQYHLLVESATTVPLKREREGVNKKAEPEDLPDQLNIIQLSGERRRM